MMMITAVVVRADDRHGKCTTVMVGRPLAPVLIRQHVSEASTTPVMILTAELRRHHDTDKYFAARDAGIISVRAASCWHAS